MSGLGGCEASTVAYFEQLHDHQIEDEAVPGTQTVYDVRHTILPAIISTPLAC